jgi:hypothetical protein
VYLLGFQTEGNIYKWPNSKYLAVGSTHKKITPYSPYSCFKNILVVFAILVIDPTILGMLSTHSTTDLPSPVIVI